MITILINNLREQAKRRSLSGYTRCLLNAAADALQDDLETRVKAVRCKDCKWFCEFCDKYKQESRKDGMCEHPKFGRYTLDTTFDWFCAYGKRKEDASKTD